MRPCPISLHFAADKALFSHYLVPASVEATPVASTCTDPEDEAIAGEHEFEARIPLLDPEAIPEAILDTFHETVPVGALDDFEFSPHHAPWPTLLHGALHAWCRHLHVDFPEDIGAPTSPLLEAQYKLLLAYLERRAVTAANFRTAIDRIFRSSYWTHPAA